MSKTLQFGFHPDADQISAFVEQALPAHERELVLGHLAVCAECRAVVALSLPEVEVPAKPVAEPGSRHAPKPWRIGWIFALPIAGALAAAVLAFDYLYPTPGTPVSHEPQLADAYPTPPIAAPPEPNAQPARRATSESRKATASGGSAVAPVPLLTAPGTGQAMGGPIVTGRNVAGLRSLSQAPSVGTEKGPSDSAKTAPASGTSMESAVSSLGWAPAKVAGAEPQTSASSVTVPKTVSNAPQQASPARNATQTVSVQSDGQTIETNSADLSNVQIAADEPQPNRPLPSKLAILSSATLGKRIVAIDSAHNVFGSKDGGKHWKQISIPMQGHPVQASLIQPASGFAQAGVSSFANLAGRLAQASSALPNSLSGTVTDRSGAVIPGASVSVTETTSGIARATRTDASGHYGFSELPQGMYRVEAQSAGFRKQELPSIAVQSAGPAIANLTLDIGEATQTVTVEASSAPLTTQTKKQSKPQASGEASSVFRIVTDSGDQWTSADGLNWKHN